MARKPPTKHERDANLDSLKSAVDKWGEKVQARLENEVKFMRAVLSDRGAKKVGTKTLDEASALLQAEIDDFIAFGPDEDRDAT
jgi:hypothetical protein